MTVDKNQFVDLLQRYAGTSAEEADMIISLKTSYPYSQLLQALAAKAAHDHELENNQVILQEAAIHVADRSVLKDIIDTEYEPSENITQTPAVHAVEAVTVEKTTEFELKAETAGVESAPVALTDTYPTTSQNDWRAPVTEFEPIEGMDVADQVLQDLERLNKLKHNFEMMFVEYTEVKAKTEAQHPPKEKSTPKSDSNESSKSKKQRIIEAARSMQATEQPVRHEKKHGKANQNDELIDEIASKKKEISPENPRQKEQIEIINHFIKTSPTINNARDRQLPPPVDLNTVKSGEFGDNIVSETLVEILIKQGKKDKAIEVLKKLIWKYPQKKAYFASQIEDLKK